MANMNPIASLSWEEYINNFNFNDMEPFLYSYRSAGATILLYLASVKILQRFMKKFDKGFQLGSFPAYHNLFLFFFSLVMFGLILWELALAYLRTDLWTLACDTEGILRSGRIFFYYYIFYWSKVYEFIDTYIQILKKREPPFLHIWHHCTTFLLMWVMLVLETSVQWMSIGLNSFVHIIMYFYYYLASKGQQVWWKKYVTILQICQFILTNSIGCFWIITYYYGEKPCRGTIFGFWFGQYILCSFLFLFIKFYFDTRALRKKNEIKKTQ